MLLYWTNNIIVYSEVKYRTEVLGPCVHLHVLWP